MKLLFLYLLCPLLNTNYVSFLFFFFQNMLHSDLILQDYGTHMNPSLTLSVYRHDLDAYIKNLNGLAIYLKALRSILMLYNDKLTTPQTGVIQSGYRRDSSYLPDYFKIYLSNNCIALRLYYLRRRNQLDIIER